MTSGNTSGQQSGLRRSLTATVTAAALVISMSACSGDDDADQAPAADDTSTDTPVDESPETLEQDEQGTPDEPDEPDEQDDVAGGAFATVTIGDLSFSFDLETGAAAACWVFDGETFFGNGYADDRSSVAFEFPAEDAERETEIDAYIIVNDAATGSEWAAGTNDLRTFEPGTSQVDSVVIDGDTATATATFIDASVDDPVPVTGTFEATCP